jgi:GH25 family lysozyme M1 (1,4-beta-N-acetylmuramidase)
VTTDFADISHHQVGVNLAAYKAAGYRRISMKATEGTGFVDPAFKARWQEAGRLGLERIAYHFQRAKFDGVKEFDFFLSVVNDAGGFGKNDSIMLDYEDPDTPSRALLGAKRFVSRAVSKGFKEGLIYTYRDYGDRTGLRPSEFPAGWQKLVIASYTAIPDQSVRLPAGWTWDQVVARQFTDHAILPGIGSTDDNHLDHEWLTAVDAVSTDTPNTGDWFDMATLADLETAVRKVLNEGTGKGQPNWAETEEATLATAQALVNKLGELGYLISYGDNADDSQDKGTHPNNLQRVRTELADGRAQVAALDAKVSALVSALSTASAGQFDLSAVEKAAEQGAQAALERVHMTVDPEPAA